jgi:uncharacterized protein
MPDAATPLPIDFPAALSIDALARRIAPDLAVAPAQVARTIELLDGKNTIPFIARYRKEVTGSLDEVQIQAIEDAVSSQRALHERKGDVLRLVAEQGKLTPELAQAIVTAATLQAVEDLYLPFRPKRKTRASVARERGLQPLADMILAQERGQGDLVAARIAAGEPFVNADNGLPTLDDVFAGARDICAEVIAEDAAVRSSVRALFMREGQVRARLAGDPAETEAKDPRGVYQLYYDFGESVARMAPHRTLAINRAEREDVVRVAVEVEPDPALDLIRLVFPVNRGSPFADDLAAAAQDGFKRLLAPAIERDVRAELTRVAEEHAIGVFAANVRQLLLQPPLRGRTIVGIDPGFRTGCKLSIVDETGKYIEGGTIFLHQQDAARQTLRAIITRHHIGAIAIGNGTASRETEQVVAEVLRQMEAERIKDVPGYMIVSEAGASVYSASEIARQEFPDLDVTQRGGISIARRLLDPLAELVKIDPKAIGVGLYQHDVDQRALGKELERVVTSCVNFAGVNVNAASAALLKHVSGINGRVAEAIVHYRDEHGPFKNREGLRKVAGLGPATFVQAAGFLKVPDGSEMLDNTFIHPESYNATRELLSLLPGDNDARLPERVRLWRAMARLQARKDADPLAELAEMIGMGMPTLADILDNLEKPGLDPRDRLPAPILRHDVLSIDDLHEGMIVQGTVRNIVDFGAFIDIGIKNDGLAHVSELADRFVRDPSSVVAVGQVVRARILSVDRARGRVQLSLRGVPREAP